MRIKEGYKLQKIMNSYVAVPDGSAEGLLNGVIRLNGTAAEIWKGIESGLDRDGIVKLILEQYTGTDEAEIGQDVDQIISRLSSAGLIED